MAEDQENFTIQRCPHDAENPYAQISRALIRDESISPECRWLLIYMLSMKDGWKMKISQIYNHVKKFIGRGKIYTLVQEAIDAGYIEKVTVKVGNLNRGCSYHVSESPKFKKCFRRSGFREAGPRGAEKPEPLSINQEDSLIESSFMCKKKQEREEEGVKPPTPLTVSPSFSFGNVKMEQSQYDKLCEEYGADKVKSKVEEFDDYSRSQPKQFNKYVCHAATVRSWLRRDAKGPSSFAQKENPKDEYMILVNKEYFSHVKELHPQETGGLLVKEDYISNPAKGKEVYFSLPSETFRSALFSLIGWSNEG